MSSHAICNKCEAPVFFNRVIDSLGNSVVSINCWNGHYKWLEIEGLIEDEVKKDTGNNIIQYLGFFGSK